MRTESIRALFQKFLKSRSGNTALIFAFSLIPIVVATGAAVDYSRAAKSRHLVQQVIDSAALAAAAPVIATDAEREEIANNYIAANMPPGIAATFPNITITTTSDKVSISISGEAETTFLQLAHIDKVDISADTAVMLAVPLAAEIVFVLDYSGSMNSTSKYGVMRDSVIGVINTLTAGDDHPEIKFGLVPFSGQVYVPSLPTEYADGSNYWWMACTQDRPYPANTTDATPDSGDSDTKWDFKYSFGTCWNYISNDLVVRELTTDYASLTSQLEDMRPHSMTHIALGMEFGYHILSPNPPFTEGVAYSDTTVKKFAVLLTDGKQTEPAYGVGGSENAEKGEENLETLCENMKADGIVVTTVAFDLDHQSTKTRLQNCATNADYYFEPNDGDELAAAFEIITQRFAEQIHIAQ